MSKSRSGLFSGTKGSIILTEDSVSVKDDGPKTFQSGRTREEYSALARDPARGTKVDCKGKKERDAGLDDSVIWYDKKGDK